MITDPHEIDRQLAGSVLEPLLAKWRTRVSGGLPAWGDFDVLELRPWIGQLTLVELLAAEEDILWRVFGTTIADRLQRDLTGFKYSERADWVGPGVFETYWEVARLGSAMLHMLNDHDQHGRYAGLVRLMMPLAAVSGGNEVHLILTAYDSADEKTIASRRALAQAGTRTA